MDIWKFGSIARSSVGRIFTLLNAQSSCLLAFTLFVVLSA